MMGIPVEVLIPAVSAILLAALAHFITVLMRSKSEKHDFSMKTFESVLRDASEKDNVVEELRVNINTLTAENARLIGEKYLSEATLKIMESRLKEAEKTILQLERDRKILEERVFQLSSEVEMLRRIVERLERRG